MKTKILAAVLAFSATCAMANPITNGDFATGDISGWSTDGKVQVLTNADGRFASMYANSVANYYTTMKQELTLNAGDVLSGYAQFVAHDYMPYNDDAYVAINGVKLFSSNIASVGNYGTSPWTNFKWTALSAGSYILSVGVANRRDSSNASEIRVANFNVASEVPEPGSIALLGLGLFGAGAARRLAAKKKQA